jgi:VWFA-related protein
MRTSVVPVVIAAAVALTAPAIAQDVYVTLARTHFTVTDPQGRPVAGLGPQDVTVYDNDLPQRIEEFGRHVDAPIDVAVLIDRSHSIGDRLPFLVAAATTFGRSVLTGPVDRGLLVAFDSKVYLLQDWTHDAGALSSALAQLTPAGGTSIFDALFKTCRDKFDISDARQNAVVLVTDGEDTTSVATFDQALRMATLSRATIYVVGVRAEHSMNTRELQGRPVLSRLAELTGGRLLYPDAGAPDELGAPFARIQQELRSAYTLTYYLDKAPDNSFHRLRIEPRDRTLVVHAPRGYYARALDPQP